MAYKPKVLTVSEGGQANTSLLAFGILFGGSTSTGAIQTIGSLGVAGQQLTSSGSGLPTWQTPGGGGGGKGYTLQLSTMTASPVDATTYFCAVGVALSTFTASGGAQTRLYIPKTGTITKVYGSSSSSVAGSSESVTIALRLNNTTDTNVTTSLNLSSTLVTFSNTGLSIAVTAGDYIEVKFIGPTWATNPIATDLEITILIT